MRRDRPDLSALYGGGIRREAWRAQLLREEIAAAAAQQRTAAAMRLAILVGVVIGVLGSAAIYL